MTRKATPETEEAWLQIARQYTEGTVKHLSRSTPEGVNPVDPQGEVREVDPIDTEVRFWVEPEVAALLAQATRQLSELAGTRLSQAKVLECLLADYLAGSPFPAQDVWDRWLVQGRRDVEAAREALRREREQVREEQAERHADRVTEEVPEYAHIATPWFAVACREEVCPSDEALKLVRPAPPHWENLGLRFNADARLVTPAQRKEMLRRDVYRCGVPGCPHDVWMDVHHVVWHCLGGPTVPENLIVVCRKCHSNLHKGRLIVTGTAPGRLKWTDGEGRGVDCHPPTGWWEWDPPGGV